METQTIGKNIAILRKEKGVTQEELANALNISAQAVSKWENGGTPDIEHIPIIADFFDVTTDIIFGRSGTNNTGLAQAITRYIQSENQENQVEKAFEICSLAEAGLFGETGPVSFDERDSDKDNYSKVMTNNGFTDMGIGKHIRYFFVLPEIKNVDDVLLNSIDYQALFNELGKKDVFDSLVYILKRKDSRKQFTKNLIHKGLGLSLERASEILDVLRKYNLLYSNILEIDDGEEIVYTVDTSGATNFVSTLIFARNMIKQQSSFYYYTNRRSKGLLE